MECLDPEFIAAFRSRAKNNSNQLKRRLPTGLLSSIVSHANRSSRLRAIALGRIDAPDGSIDLLASLLRQSDPILRKEAIRTLGRDTDPRSVELLSTICSLNHNSSRRERIA